MFYAHRDMFDVFLIDIDYILYLSHDMSSQNAVCKRLIEIQNIFQKMKIIK